MSTEMQRLMLKEIRESIEALEMCLVYDHDRLSKDWEIKLARIYELISE